MIIAILIFLNFKIYSNFFVLKTDILFSESIYNLGNKNILELQNDSNKKEYEDLVKEKDSLNILNYEGQVKFLLKEVEKITIDSGLILNSINFNPKAVVLDSNNDSIKQVMFNLNILGTYEGLKGWLVKIHELKIASINRIIFSIADIQKPTNFQVEFKMYYK